MPYKSVLNSENFHAAVAEFSDAIQDQHRVVLRKVSELIEISQTPSLSYNKREEMRKEVVERLREANAMQAQIDALKVVTTLASLFTKYEHYEEVTEETVG